MKLAIEMDDINGDTYGVIHKAGCRDLSDGMPIGEASTMAEVQRAAEDATGWGYDIEDGELYRVSPCVKLER